MASRFLTPFDNRGLLRDPLLDLHREVNRLFDESLRTIRQGGSEAMIAPRVDICPVDNGWEVTAELPGVDEKDIDLRLDGDMLTISGEKRDERKDDKNRLVERNYGAFTRSFQLPFTPDPDKVTADCKNGVLTIKLPRGAEQERSKRIAIGQGAGGAVEAGKSDQSAIGKDWTKEEQARTSDLSEEQAEKGQGAPA